MNIIQDAWIYNDYQEFSSPNTNINVWLCAWFIIEALKSRMRNFVEVEGYKYLTFTDLISINSR